MSTKHVPQSLFFVLNNRYTSIFHSTYASYFTT